MHTSSNIEARGKRRVREGRESYKSTCVYVCICECECVHVWLCEGVQEEEV